MVSSRDGSDEVVQGSDSFSIGMIIRDHIGTFQAGKVMRLAGNISVYEAEAVGILEALSWIDDRQDGHVVIESDSLLSVRALQKDIVQVNELGTVLNFCKDMLKNRSDISIQFVRKQANRAAHVMARVLCMLGGYNMILNPPYMVIYGVGDFCL